MNQATGHYHGLIPYSIETYNRKETDGLGHVSTVKEIKIGRTKREYRY